MSDVGGGGKGSFLLDFTAFIGHGSNMSLSRKDWFLIENVEEVESPALLIYPERVNENIRRMVALAGQPARLRPHAKTHKLAQVAARQIAVGIKKFKAATIAEVEMLARAGAANVLLAYQPVGPNARRFLELIAAFPQTTFACLLDDFQAAQKLSELTQRRAGAAHPTTVNVLLDIDCGQRRTGVPPNERAIQLYQEISVLPGRSHPVRRCSNRRETTGTRRACSGWCPAMQTCCPS